MQKCVLAKGIQQSIEVGLEECGAQGCDLMRWEGGAWPPWPGDISLNHFSLDLGCVLKDKSVEETTEVGPSHVHWRTPWLRRVNPSLFI